MHRIRRFFAAMLTVCVLAGMLPLTAVLAKPEPRSTKIYSCTGEVQIRRGGDRLLPAFEGMRLEQGDTLLTGSASSAVIEIDSDKTVDVDANTEITLDTLAGTAEKSQTGISVFFGNIVNSIQNKLADGSSFETSTSTAVMGVRGTTYLVSQSAQKVDVIVSSGTVAVSEAPRTPQEPPATPVEVQKGSAYVPAEGQERVGSSAPVRSENLLELSPGAARALVTEELLAAIPDKPPELASVEQLVGVLAERQELAVKQEEQRIVEKAAEITRQQAAEPPAFFELAGEKLTGKASELITPPALQTDKPATVPAAPAAPPAAPAAPANPNVAATPAAPETPSAPAKENTPSDNKDKESTSSSGANSGSSDSDSGGSGGGSTPTPPTAVTVGTVTSAAVHADVADGSTGPFVALAISWKKDVNAQDFTYAIKETNETFSLTPVVKNKYYRLFFSADDEQTYSGKTLVITPVVSGTHLRAVPQEIVLNFGAAPSTKIRQLCTPNVDKIEIILVENAWIVQFKPVSHTDRYAISLEKDGTQIKSETFTIEGGNGIYAVPKETLFGTVAVQLTAMGDGFDTLDSDGASKEIDLSGSGDSDTPNDPDEPTGPTDPNTLQPPSDATVYYDTSSSNYIVSWSAVEGATGYTVSAGSGMWKVSSDTLEVQIPYYELGYCKAFQIHSENADKNSEKADVTWSSSGDEPPTS